MPEGKYFFIRSKLNDLVLDLDSGSREPGTRVVTWFQKPDENDSELWFEDHLNGTIRNKLNELCLTVDDEGYLVVDEYDVNRQDQQWLTAGNRIQNRTDSSSVLEVSGTDPAEGALVTSAHVEDSAQQKWTFEYNPARFFYIRSRMHDKVIDVKNAGDVLNAKVVVRAKSVNIRESQLWYENKYGIICSKLNDFVLESGDDSKIRLQPYESGNKSQLWTFQEDRIVNRVEPTLVLDIKGGSRQDGVRVISYPWRDQPNQKWSLDYV